MPLTIPDETLEAAELDPGRVGVEVVLRLRRAKLLSAGAAARLAGMERDDVERAVEAMDAPTVERAELDLEPEVRAWLDTLDTPGDAEHERWGPLTLSDRRVTELGLTPQAARVELACRLFAVLLLGKPTASRWAELSRVEFEGELNERKLPWIILTYRSHGEELRRLEKELTARKSNDARHAGRERHLTPAGAGVSRPVAPAASDV